VGGRLLVVLALLTLSASAARSQVEQLPAAQQAESLCVAGEADYQKASYKSARDNGQQCAEIFDRLALPRGVARANQLLSVIADVEGNAEESAARARRALVAYQSAGDRRGRALATLQLIRVAKLDRAEETRLFQEVISDARAAGERGLEARALHSFGDHLFGAGRYEDALDKLNEAAAIFGALDDRRALGRVYNSVGRLYRTHERVEEALTFQLKALALHETAAVPLDLIQSLNAVAVTYQALGDSTHARLYFERALALAEKSGTPRIQDFLRANIVPALIREGAYGEAAEQLEGVIARGLDAYPSRRMRELSAVYVKMGRRDEAMALAERALAACTRQEIDCLYALDQRAAVQVALGHAAAALADTEAALGKLETIRSRLVPADFFKQQFTEAQASIYSRAIALQLADGRAADALATAERARSRAFVDLLASKDLQPREPAPIDELPLVFRGQGLPSQVSARAATAADLAAAAKRLGSTLLAYWVTDDRLFIWILSPEGAVQSAQVEVRASKLEELIRATSPPSAKTSKSVQASRTSNAWTALYDLLIKPVRRSLPRQPGALITVVPHGPLSALAFAALQDARGRYLLEDYTLHYVPAGAILQFTAARRHAESRSGRVLLVSDPVPPTLSKLDAPLPPLAGARAEVRSIARLLPSDRVTSLEGEAATEVAIRAAAARSGVLHFAMHAIVHDEDPFGSFLAVTPAAQGAGADGFLTAREIYGLDLDADLVVLSACRSAGGRVSGDGIATFARAFMYAGTTSLVASVWDVADQPANRLLPDFYREWLGGASKARALRTAQLRLLHDLRANKLRIDTPLGKIALPEHPIFWAGFVLFGEPD
jgi:CHAT domain-containing protein